MRHRTMEFLRIDIYSIAMCTSTTSCDSLYYCKIWCVYFSLSRSPIILYRVQLKEIIRLETERKTPKLWHPSLPKVFTWSTWEPSETLEREDDENPGILFRYYLPLTMVDNSVQRRSQE